MNNKKTDSPEASKDGAKPHDNIVLTPIPNGEKRSKGYREPPKNRYAFWVVSVLLVIGAGTLVIREESHLWKITMLIYTAYIFITIGSVGSLLLALTFSPNQRSRFRYLTVLHEKKSALAAIAVIALVFGYGLSASRDVVLARESFARQQGPGTSEAFVATPSAFELELLETAAQSVNRSRSNFLAAQESFLVGDFEGATPRYRESLHAIKTLSAYLNLGISLRWVSNFSEAKQVLEEGLRLSEIRKNLRFRAHFLFQLGTVENYIGDRTSSEPKLLEAARLYRELRDEVGEADAFLNLGVLYHETGRGNEAGVFRKKARTLYEQSHNALGLANVTNNEAVARITSGNVTGALDLYRHAAERYARIYSKVGEATARLGIANSLAGLDRLSDAEVEAKRAINLAREGQNKGLEIQAGFTLAGIQSEKGESERAIVTATEVIKKARAIDLESVYIATLVFRAELLLRDGSLADSLADVEEAFAHAEAANDGYGRAAVRVVNGELLLKMEKPGEALNHFLQAQHISEESRNRFTEVRAIAGQGRALLVLGNRTQGEQLMRRALGIYRSMGDESREAEELSAFLKECCEGNNV